MQEMPSSSSSTIPPSARSRGWGLTVVEPGSPCDPHSPAHGGLRGRGLVLRHLRVRARVRGQVPSSVSGSRREEARDLVASTAAATRPPKRWDRRGPGCRGPQGPRGWGAPSLSSQGPAPRGSSRPHPAGRSLWEISALSTRPPGEGPGASLPAPEARELDPALNDPARRSGSPKPGASCGHGTRVGAGRDLVGQQEPRLGRR